MNFLGHAAVARWWTRAPAAHFGAMLPDFAAMVRATPPRVVHPEIARGVALHHATDEAFHRNGLFRALSGEGVRTLEGQGVRRGTALAAAHVGVEILIDCVLARDPEVAADFLGALAAGAPQALGAGLAFGSDDDRARYARLHAVLVDRGLGAGDPDADRVAERVVRSLAGRPRLAAAAPDRAPIAEWLRRALRPVEVALPELLTGLAAALERSQGLRAYPPGAALAANGWGHSGPRSP